MKPHNKKIAKLHAMCAAAYCVSLLAIATLEPGIVFDAFAWTALVSVIVGVCILFKYEV